MMLCQASTDLQTAELMRVSMQPSTTHKLAPAPRGLCHLTCHARLLTLLKGLAIALLMMMGARLSDSPWRPSNAS